MKNIDVMHEIEELFRIVEAVLGDSWDRTHDGREQLLDRRELGHLEDTRGWLYDMHSRLLANWREEEPHD